MTTTAIAGPEGLDEKLPLTVQWARSLRITTPEECQDVIERLKTIKAMSRQVADYFSPMKKSADATKRAILEAEKKLAQPLADAEAAAKLAVLKYQTEEENKRQAETRRLQAEADERARRERERLQKQAEKLKTPELREERLAAAAQVTAPVVIVSPPAKVNGVVTRKTWQFKIEDESKLPREFLTPDTKKLDKYVKAMGSGAVVPGVRFYQEESLAVGRAS